MIVNFGKGKCPVCGDFAKRQEDVSQCRKCNITFNEFSLLDCDEIAHNYKYWT